MYRGMLNGEGARDAQLAAGAGARAAAAAPYCVEIDFVTSVIIRTSTSDIISKA